MSKVKITPPRFYSYQALLGFVNEPLTAENWRARLQEVEAWQLEWELGLESDEDLDRTPEISGRKATYEGAQELRVSLRRQLTELVQLCLHRQRLVRESEEFGRGGRKAWTWRKALVLPTREIFFEDAGEALNFFAEALEYEIKWRVKGARSAPTKGGRQWLNRRLHLSLCACGCGQFFLWEGNWNRRQRKFLDDRHRMGFHNRKNVERKRIFAHQQYKAGVDAYFK